MCIQVFYRSALTHTRIKWLLKMNEWISAYAIYVGACLGRLDMVSPPSDIWLATTGAHNPQSPLLCPQLNVVGDGFIKL